VALATERVSSIIYLNMRNFVPIQKEGYFLIILIIFSLMIKLFILLQPFSIIDGYLSDDAYYYFVIVRNLIEGHGIIFNENVPTNGFHPLYIFILIPIFASFIIDPILPIYIVLFILILLNIGTGITLYFIGKYAYNVNTGVIASFFWLFNPYIFKTTLLGLETSISLFFISLFVYYCLKKRDKNSLNVKELFIFSFLITLIFLSRLDGIFLFISVIFFLFMKKINNLKKKKRFHSLIF